ncbi:hypothetical protein AcW1_002976 [Taiwanofungus camphoratus]|nr:hypothetical protein AcV5_001837 [Antrodia cinnamomea]KAI0925339.1 hypothetical protein AcV7_005610 [Antrodia cinnamomea]KAI0942317.1 hypothetical protein AcW1_002976 [Antrodia cinnamomea]
MMFRAVALLTFALSALAVPQYGPTSQCDSGSELCCDSVYSPGTVYATSLIKALNIDNVPVGHIATGCGGGGVNVGGGSTCNTNPVCCQGNALGGLIGVGCAAIPVSI